MEGNKKPLMGVVVNCMNLNIRKDPTQASRSLGILYGKDPSTPDGDDGVEPRLPLPDEVIKIMTAEG